ncbi:GNAT family N-acetyltransferase [Micromonospora arborensis]|uniref:GNAT family N-acetyltransferase n=1 Tax=Micromonospora arborensis TaxID=2116518 RepID=UPI0033F63378
MVTGGSDDNVIFRRAGVDDMAEVLIVLDEAAAWLRERGISQWPARFEPSWIEDAIRRGETWLIEINNETAGTVTLDWVDPIWADVGGQAAYVHRMAVRRWASGLGTVILAWAADTALHRSRHALRLDCVAANLRLCAYYEASGFVHCGDVAVGGAPGQREQHGPVTMVSRYELPLHAAGKTHHSMLRL